MRNLLLCLVAAASAACSRAEARVLEYVEPAQTEVDGTDDLPDRAEGLSNKLLMIAHRQCMQGMWHCGSYLSHCRLNGLDGKGICKQYKVVCDRIVDGCMNNDLIATRRNGDGNQSQILQDTSATEREVLQGPAGGRASGRSG